MANNKSSSKREVKPVSPPVSRAQRSLMFMAGSILGLGIIAIIALLIGEATLTPAAFEGSAIWAVLAFLPEVAIPLGFALFIALIVVTYVTRSRASKVVGK